jgi:hypothetical protein
LSNLEGLTKEGLDHLMDTSSLCDAKSNYVDTSDNNSCLSADHLKPAPRRKI